MDKTELLKQRKDRCKLAIERGYSYDLETGDIYSRLGKKIISKDKDGYCIIRFKYLNKYYEIKSHQFAWYYVYEEVVECIDHINKIKTDNTLSNLRSISQQENLFNTNAKGYTLDKEKNKWRASIYVGGKVKYLGKYRTEEEARSAYLEAKKEYHIIKEK